MWSEAVISRPFKWYRREQKVGTRAIVVLDMTSKGHAMTTYYEVTYGKPYVVTLEKSPHPPDKLL